MKKNNYIEEDLINHDLTKNFEKLKDRVTCSICSGLLNSSLLCQSCRNPYCKSCIEDLTKCPNCRIENFKKVNPDINLTLLLELIVLTCPNCKENKSLDQYPTHMKKCSIINCPLCKKCKIDDNELKLKDLEAETKTKFINQNKEFLETNYCNKSSLESDILKLKQTADSHLRTIAIKEDLISKITTEYKNQNQSLTSLLVKYNLIEKKNNSINLKHDEVLKNYKSDIQIHLSKNNELIINQTKLESDNNSLKQQNKSLEKDCIEHKEKMELMKIEVENIKKEYHVMKLHLKVNFLKRIIVYQQ